MLNNKTPLRKSWHLTYLPINLSTNLNTWVSVFISANIMYMRQHVRKWKFNLIYMFTQTSLCYQKLLCVRVPFLSACSARLRCSLMVSSLACCSSSRVWSLTAEAGSGSAAALRSWSVLSRVKSSEKDLRKRERKERSCSCVCCHNQLCGNVFKGENKLFLVLMCKNRVYKWFN